MIGKGKQFDWVKCDEFEFPEFLSRRDPGFTNERQFIEFLIRNDWIQRKLGILMFSSNGLFPDVHGEVYDGSGTKINVEVEYDCRNFIQHGHSWRGVDLILCFKKPEAVRFIKGIPVWAFYEYSYLNNDLYYCLDNTMGFDFSKVVEYD